MNGMGFGDAVGYLGMRYEGGGVVLADSLNGWMTTLF